MKRNELCTYTSLDDLMSSCCNSKLIDFVHGVMCSPAFAGWSFISASADGEINRIVLASRSGFPGKVFRLCWECSPASDRGHIDLVDSAMVSWPRFA